MKQKPLPNSGESRKTRQQEDKAVLHRLREAHEPSGPWGLPGAGVPSSRIPSALPSSPPFSHSPPPFLSTALPKGSLAGGGDQACSYRFIPVILTDDWKA